MDIYTKNKSNRSTPEDNNNTKYLAVFKRFIPSSNSVFSFKGMLYIIGLIQVGLLNYLFVDSIKISIMSLLVFSLIYIVSFPIIRRFKVPGLIEHIWATASVGGIGMLLGHQLDTYLSDGSKQMHHHTGAVVEFSTADILPFLLSGMTIIMLIFCISACLYSCNRCLSHYGAVEKWVLHSGSIVFMLFGMLLAAKNGQWLSSVSNSKGDIDHYFMLSLMVLFSACAYFIISKGIDRVKHSIIHEHL